MLCDAVRGDGYADADAARIQPDVHRYNMLYHNHFSSL